jgi:hypothetical protein
MKEGNLICFVVMGSTELRCFRSCSWCLWKALDKEGCMGLASWCLDLQCKSSWILNYFFTKNKIKSWLIFLKELECAFGVVGKILMSGKVWNVQNTCQSIKKKQIMSRLNDVHFIKKEFKHV